MPPTAVPTRESLLTLAQQIIMRSSEGDFSKSEEARVRSLTHLIGAVTDGGASQRKSEVPAGFIDWLKVGKNSNWQQPQRRALSDATGGPYPGGGGGFTPVEFNDVYWSALKAVDDLFDPAVTTILTSLGAGPYPAVLVDDTENAAALVAQNAQSTPSDIPVSSIQFGTAPTWRSGLLKLSREIIQDSGIDLLAVLTAAFGVRFQRGFSAGLVTQLLAACSIVRTSGGATASGQSMGGGGGSSTTFGTDDLSATLAALDPAYLQNASWLMSEATLAKVLSLRTATTGALVFGGGADEDGTYTIFGKPVRICPSMPGLGASNTPVLLGDLKRLAIRKVRDNGFWVSRAEETFAEYLVVAFESFTRADSGVLFYASDPSTSSPFVGLACHS
jgi:HK97 family phage major capsid protein